MKRRFAALFCAVLFCGAAGGCAEIGASSEPPLTEEDWNEPLPDFLDEEQQALYLRAKAIFPVFSGDTTNIDSMFGGEAGGESFEQDGVRYCISTGRYRQWADFMEMMRSIFTEEYIAELTGAETDSPAFFEKDGLLCYLEGARGSRFGYQESDEFQLTEETEEEVSFDLIGHYLPVGGGEIYTESYPIRMVRTEAGWRIAEFARAQ
ncbi:MAG TPA: hypothetical protein IAB55_04645 [Candidatus Merdivicinus faecavium]|nr:hypothetical protein [Candidatus Merdivicinus faecavium]